MSPPLQAGIATALVAVLLGLGYFLATRTDPVLEKREASSRLETATALAASADADLRLLRERQATEAVRAAQRETARGTLAIATEPEGASLYLNDVPMGSAPTTLSDLRLGRYDLRATLDGFTEQNLTLDVPEGATTVPSIRLARATGKLKIDTIPTGLPLRIERYDSPVADEPFETIKAVAPYETMLPTGSYSVYTTRAEYPEAVTNASVPADGVEALKINMTPAHIEITSMPSGADVFRGEEKVGTTPYIHESNETIRGTFEIRMAGYESGTVYAGVDRGSVYKLEVQLRQVETPDTAP